MAKTKTTASKSTKSSTKAAKPGKKAAAQKAPAKPAAKGQTKPAAQTKKSLSKPALSREAAGKSAGAKAKTTVKKTAKSSKDAPKSQAATKAKRPAKEAPNRPGPPPPAPPVEAPKPGVGMNSKRKLGLRGAAPWAARHAAKHAAEARARAAEPAPPGSARATIRVPTGAEEIKAKIAELHTQTQKIRTLRKRLEKGFFEIGQILGEIQIGELYLAKGYGSFEAFLEREIDLGKMTSLRLIKISNIFQREAAYDYGIDRLFAALSALEGEVLPKPAPSAPGSKPLLPLKPPTRMVG